MCLVFRIEQELSCENICKDIQKLINQYQAANNNLANGEFILYIDIKPIIESVSPPLLVEHKVE